MFTIYALISESTGYIYVGMTQNIDKRLLQHNRGWSNWSKRYRPWKIIYTETAPDRTQARKREVQLKSGHGKEFLKKYAGVV